MVAHKPLRLVPHLIHKRMPINLPWVPRNKSVRLTGKDVVPAVLDAQEAEPFELGGWERGFVGFDVGGTFDAVGDVEEGEAGEGGEL